METFKVRVTTAGGAEQVTEYRTMAPAARWFLQWVGNPAGDAELSDGTGTWRPDADDPRVLVRTDGWRYKVPEALAGKRRVRGCRNRFGPDEAAAIRNARAAGET